MAEPSVKKIRKDDKDIMQTPLTSHRRAPSSLEGLDLFFHPGPKPSG